MDKLKRLADYCWDKNRCEYCEHNQNMFEKCPYKEEFTEKYMDDYFAECEYYSLDIEYIIDKIR